jgi:enoyl-CoA hydratase/carnithine racemase
MTASTAIRKATDEAPLLREQTGAVAVLMLNRPQARNALSEALLAAISGELASIAADSTVRAVVIAANGSVFCAGHDLRELTARRHDTDKGRTYFAQLMDRCSSVMQAIVDLPQPVIAAVDGVATAAGCQLVASCDLAVASPRSGFCTPGVDIGLFCSTPMVALTRNVAPKHAMEMLLTGEVVPSDHALRIGLINRIAEDPRTEAIALATRIASKSAMTVRTGKQAFYRQREMTLAEAYKLAAGVMVENMLKFDAQEGIGAFLEKRKPEWKDR